MLLSGICIRMLLGGGEAMGTGAVAGDGTGAEGD